MFFKRRHLLAVKEQGLVYVRTSMCNTGKGEVNLKWLSEKKAKNLGSRDLCRTQFWQLGQNSVLWLTVGELVRAGSHRQGQQHHKAMLVWARDKDSIQGVVSFWVNNTGQSLQTAPLPHLSDDTHKRVQQPKARTCARSQHSSLFQAPTELKATSWHLLPPLWSHTLLC